MFIVVEKKNRFVFLDLLRGLSVVWMIETHVLNVALGDSWKRGEIYDFLNQSNGFVAVAFLFCTGAGFWIAWERKRRAWQSLSPELWIFLRRVGFLFLVGYGLNLPDLSLRKVLADAPASLEGMAMCDILHVIAFSSLACLLISEMVRPPRALALCFAALSLTVFYATATVWLSQTPEEFPVFVRSWISRSPYSKFPLFPWMGYFFAGAAVTAFFIRSSARRLWASIFLIAGLAAPSVVFYVKDLPWHLPGGAIPDDWWHASLGHALYRLGVVVGAFGFFYLIQNPLMRIPAVGKVLSLFGQESLLMYVGHIMIVYGTAANHGIRFLAPGAFSPAPTAAIFAAVLAAGYGAARFWRWFRKEFYPESRLLLAFLLGAYIFAFFLN